MWRIILKRKSIVSRFLIIFQWDPLLYFFFPVSALGFQKGKRASVTISWLALHSPQSRPALQPAQSRATAPDVTGAFLLCCRWGFGSRSSGVCDGPCQYTMLYGTSINANTTPCSLKGRHHQQFIHLKEHAEMASGNLFIIVSSCQDWKIRRSAFLKWHTKGGVVGV